MLIDWFTITAQALNFLILVWLLKRFLYKPILHALDAREKRIATELADADTKKADAQKERDEFQHKNEEFAHQRAALLNKATAEAEAERQRLLDEARQAAVTLRAKQQESLRDEQRSLHQALSRRTSQEVFAIARKALNDLADTSLEERMVDVFMRRLRALKGKEKEALVSALKASPDPLIVRTTFGLSPALATATEEAIKETLGLEMQVRFETAPGLISGIELAANGKKVAWSIAEYLNSLEQGVAELLKDKNSPAAAEALSPEEPQPVP
ncbi:MAG: F0F1 ATP synthase subunit B [Proteobacteria bacterium]|nr:F0F1 ATP synthase subunit B [Pseudomonadota bacterium]MBU1641337.1 F0F1 ATP synthase subunit B [Pseudomonadota bacterium]